MTAILSFKETKIFMKVGFFVNSLREDGLAVYCSRLAESFDCEVVLFTHTIDVPDSSMESLVSSYCEVVLTNYSMDSCSLRSVLELRKLILRERINVIHVHEMHCLKRVSPVGWLTGIPIFGTSHLGMNGSSNRNRWSKLIFSMGLSRVLARTYFAISTEIEREFLHEYMIRPDQVQKVLTGVDLDYFKAPSATEKQEARAALGLPNDAIVFIQLGRLADVKRPFDSLNAFLKVRDRLPHGKLHLIFAGEGPMEAGMKAFITKHGLDDSVHLLGFQEASLVLWASDSLLLPSSVEGFAMVVVEAMACGVVPIRTNTEGCSDQIEHGRNGYQFTTGDVDELAKLMTLCMDQALRLKLRSKSLETANTHFCISNLSSRVMSKYLEFVK